MTTFTDRSASAKAVLLVCAAIMFCCAAIEGLFLSFATIAGLGQPGTPLLVWAFLCVWLALFVATLVYFKYPVASLAVSWLHLLVFADVYSHYAQQQSSAGSLSMFGLPLGYVAASHFGYFMVLTKRQTPTTS
jgi:hypothetical protein